MVQVLEKAEFKGPVDEIYHHLVVGKSSRLSESKVQLVDVSQFLSPNFSCALLRCILFVELVLKVLFCFIFQTQIQKKGAFPQASTGRVSQTESSIFQLMQDCATSFLLLQL